jgi:O-methyltransferase
MTPVDRAISEHTPLLYLDLLKGCLTRSLFPEQRHPLSASPAVRSRPAAWAVLRAANSLLRPLRLELAQTYREADRLTGKDWPTDAETMVGRARLDNIQYCLTDVLHQGIPGDVIETGVWRGGASIFMRAILKAYGNEDKTVWLADSFEGLPKPDPRFPQDKQDRHWQYSDVLAVSMDQVKENFARYGLLDHRVRFLPGWFKDTLAASPINRISLLRLDGDMYASTMDALIPLYPKLSSGGYAIIDDYGVIEGCRQAVDDFRKEYGVHEPLQNIDGSGVFWRKA